MDATEPDPDTAKPATPTPATQPDAPAVDGDVTMVSREQQRHMFALWTDLGFGDDAFRDERLAITAKILNMTEAPASSNLLTAAEADALIEALKDRKAALDTQGATP